MSRNTSIQLATLLAATLLLGGPTLAQQTHGGHGSHAGHGAAPAAAKDSASTTAFKAANTKMHKDMDVAFTGDADVDFVRGMIPHHQGAIDMAKIVLAHGKDPKIRALASGVITEQEKEIATMREWLKANGK